jgi:Flp pilus assembly pilin Flp
VKSVEIAPVRVLKYLTTDAYPLMMGVLGRLEVYLMRILLERLWADEQGQDIAEYAVMLAVILLLVVGTIKLIGTNASSTFSNVASTMQ